MWCCYISINFIMQVLKFSIRNFFFPRFCLTKSYWTQKKTDNNLQTFVRHKQQQNHARKQYRNITKYLLSIWLVHGKWIHFRSNENVCVFNGRKILEWNETSRNVFCSHFYYNNDPNLVMHWLFRIFFCLICQTSNVPPFCISIYLQFDCCLV